MEYVITRRDDELYHYGVKGMKWGVRRSMKTAISQLKNNKPIGSDAINSIKRAGGIRKANKDGHKAVKQEFKQIREDYTKQKVSLIKNSKTTKKGEDFVKDLLIPKQIRDNIDRQNRMGRPETSTERVERINKIGRVPTISEMREHNNKYNI